MVDDEPLNRQLLRRTLQTEYEIVEASNAFEAIDLLETESNVSLILCDQLMPGKTGTELAAIVRERWPAIPFLLLTGYDHDHDVVSAAESGMVRTVLPKPWRSKDLRATIADTLR